MEGVTAEGTDEILSYDALSYSWGYPELDDVLICNGAARPISHSNAAALRALRHDSEPVFLWIDAICINQEDKQEKSEQVSEMLTIYKKARSVIAWLGAPDADGWIALRCIEELPSIERALSENPEQCHNAACFDKMKMVHASLLNFHNQPLLGRTWVRQEIYAARNLMVQCGPFSLSWKDFVRLAELVTIIGCQLADGDGTRKSRELKVSTLLKEAQRNTVLPPNGVKPPRNLIEVLLQSKDFAVTDPRDTFYAILGMCNVSSFTRASRDHERSPNAVLLDYSKSIAEVLQDASLYLMNCQNNSTSLANLWHSYKRGNEHSGTLPTWAVDWRSGTLDDACRASLQDAMRTRQEIFKRQSSGGFFALWMCEWVSPNSDEGLPDDGTVDIDPARHWVPLWSHPHHGQGSQPTENLDAFELVPREVLKLPDSLQPDRSVICLKARELNYVAHLTDYTCGLEHFLTATHHFYRAFLGLEGLSIHARQLPRKNHTFLRMTELGCVSLEPYGKASHSWRIAILGVGNDAQVALVPSIAKKGDIVIGVGPGMLPMLISPLQSGATTAGLFPEDDPYERIPLGTPSPARYERIASVPSVLLPILLIAFHIPLSRIPARSAASTPLLVCYGIIIPPCLAYSLWMIHLSMRRTHVHPLALPNVDEECNLVIWEKFMVYITLTAFPACISLTTGLLQTIFIVYFCLTIGTLLLGRIWLYQRRLSDNITIARRRTQVSTRLDKVSKTLNHEFDFHGPIFVKMDRVYWSFPRWIDHHIFRRCFFRFVVWANNCTKSGPPLKTTDFDWFFTEVFTSRGDYLRYPHKAWLHNKLYPWHNEKVRAWDRTVQEFRLR